MRNRCDHSGAGGRCRADLVDLHASPSEPRTVVEPGAEEQPRRDLGVDNDPRLLVLATVVGTILSARQRLLRLSQRPERRGALQKIPMSHGVPIEVVGGEVSEIAAQIAVAAHDPEFGGRDVLVMAGKDDQVICVPESCSARTRGDVTVGEVVDPAIPPRQPVQEVQVVLAEMWGDATAKVVPAEPNGCTLVPRRVPGIAPAVAVLILEV